MSRDDESAQISALLVVAFCQMCTVLNITGVCGEVSLFCRHFDRLKFLQICRETIALFMVVENLEEPKESVYLNCQIVHRSLTKSGGQHG